MLLRVDSNKNYVFDVLIAIRIFSDSRKSVIQETIRNCFRHSEFMPEIEDSATGQDSAIEST